MKRPDGFDAGFQPESGDQRTPVAPPVGEAVPEAPREPQRSADSASGAYDGDSTPGWDAESPAPATAPTAIAKAWLGDVVQRGTQALEARSADPLRDAKRRVRDAERSVKRRERRERKRFSAAGRRKRLRLMVVGGSVLALALFVLIGVFTPIMSVRNIEVTGTTTLDPVVVADQLSSLQGEPLALVSKGDVFTALEEFPLIERFGIELVPPSTLIVRVKERTPVVSLKGDGGYMLYDAAGVEVGTAAERPTGVPLGSEQVSDVSTPAFAEAARIVRDLPDDPRNRIVTVAAKGAQDVRFTLDNGVEVFWGNRERTQAKSAVLVKMLASLQDRGVSYIDVSSSEAPVFR
ncbi:FtsQ-type POTRA domain-containing protein [Leucobacter sp. cx-42]|uniref:FtsQ-type POTRA domain-containing protein n=1 Tax=unclassified Leucobacter TaxID=2621730 RepID=UPI00165D70D2|nr:FtsQ-type POTRA domain-containing protein [Leucobacter sp. cx-42]